MTRLIFAILGAVIGLGSGWLAVFLESRENLAAEEEQDFATYRQEFEVEHRQAVDEDRPEPLIEEWKFDRYGWTWLEWGLSPFLGALGFFVFVAHEPLSLQLWIHLLWMALFVHIIAFDIKHRLILNVITFPAFILALLFSLFTPNLGLLHAVIGAIAVYLFFLVPSLIWGGTVIGRGDAKLGAIVGAITGISGAPDHLGAVYALIWTVFLGGAGALLVLLVKSLSSMLKARSWLDIPKLFLQGMARGLKEPIAYGPFLCLGAILILYQGP